MILHLGPLDGGDQSMELAVAHALVLRASRGEVGEVVRLYRPSAPVAVFGRRDLHRPGFPRAVEAAERAGFATAIRATGGRAVAYTERSIVVDHVMPDSDAVAGLESRFVRLGGQSAEGLRALGVDARPGAVPGEYCPGTHSVNARGVVKIVGTAQRAIKGAWLFSALVVAAEHTRLRPLLTEIYRHLDLPFDPASVGSVTGEQPALSVESVEAALLDAHGVAVADLAPLDRGTLALAEQLVAQHRI